MKRTPLLRKTKLVSTRAPRKIRESKLPSEPARTARGPIRDPGYLVFVRRQPCIVDGCKSRSIEAHHFARRGVGQKCSDHQTVPICTAHHREWHDTGTINKEPRGFWVERFYAKAAELQGASE